MSPVPNTTGILSSIRPNSNLTKSGISSKALTSSTFLESEFFRDLKKATTVSKNVQRNHSSNMDRHSDSKSHREVKNLPKVRSSNFDLKKLDENKFDLTVVIWSNS